MTTDINYDAPPPYTDVEGGYYRSPTRRERLPQVESDAVEEFQFPHQHILPSNANSHSHYLVRVLSDPDKISEQEVINLFDEVFRLRIARAGAMHPRAVADESKAALDRSHSPSRSAQAAIYAEQVDEKDIDLDLDEIVFVRPIEEGQFHPVGGQRNSPLPLQRSPSPKKLDRTGCCFSD